MIVSKGFTQQSVNAWVAVFCRASGLEIQPVFAEPGGFAQLAQRFYSIMHRTPTERASLLQAFGAVATEEEWPDVVVVIQALGLGHFDVELAKVTELRKNQGWLIASRAAFDIARRGEASPWYAWVEIQSTLCSGLLPRSAWPKLVFDHAARLTGLEKPADAQSYATSFACLATDKQWPALLETLEVAAATGAFNLATAVVVREDEKGRAEVAAMLRKYAANVVRALNKDKLEGRVWQ